MKTLTICFVSLVVCISHAQVTYRTTGATVAKVVGAVADQTGEKLAVHKDLANEIVVVAVRDVTLGEFQAKLADCLAGKWIEKAGGVRELAIDSTTSNKQRAAAQEAYAQVILSQFESSRKLYEQEGMRGIAGDNSAAKLAIDIGEKLGIKSHELALPWQRVVFSSHPNRFQKQLPDVWDLVEKTAPTKAVAEVVFAIERPNAAPFTRYLLNCYDAAGRSVIHAHTSLMTIEKQTAPSTEGSPVKWSNVSIELAKLYGTWDFRATQGLLNLPKLLTDALSKPTEIDPISFGFGEGILACGDEWKENVIASVSDDEYYWQARTGLTTGEFWGRLKRRISLVCDRADGWVIVRPADPIEARRTRGDRIALERLIAKTKEANWALLDDVAEFAMSNPNCRQLPQSFLFSFQSMVNYYGEGGAGYISGDIRHLQLYGSLPKSTRAKLEAGEAIPFGSLPSAAKAILTAMVYEPAGALLMGAVIEPTEIMPGGLPSGAMLTASVSQVTLIAPMPDAGEPSMPVRGMDAAAIAVQRWSSAHDDSPYAQEVPQLNRVVLGTRKVWHFRVTLEGKEIAACTVADDVLSKERKVTTMGELPDKVRAELEKAYQDYLKYMGGGG